MRRPKGQSTRATTEALTVAAELRARSSAELTLFAFPAAIRPQRSGGP